MGIDKKSKSKESFELYKSDSKVYGKTKAVKKKLIAERGQRCQQCGRTPTTLDAHHLITIRQGGANDGSNLILLCESCHMSEHFARKRR